MIDLQRAIGLNGRGADGGSAGRPDLARLVYLTLAANGLPTVAADGAAGRSNGDGDGDGRSGAGSGGVAAGLLANYRERIRLLEDYRCPADRRSESFLFDHFADLGLAEPLRLPGHTLVLDRHGVARELSLPAGGDEYVGPLVSSYRVRNGVLHNPKSDRRTTAGTFHVTEGGLPVPGTRRRCPRSRSPSCSAGQ